MQYDPSLVGSTIQQYPLKELMTNLALGIAEAQRALDNASIETAIRMMTEQLTITDSKGTKHTRSLLELGFLPTFYHFTSATISVSVSITMKIEEQTSFGFGIGISASHSRSTESYDDRLPDPDEKKPDSIRPPDVPEPPVKIKGQDYTLDQLKQMNTGSNNTEGLWALGATLTPPLDYDPAVHTGATDDEKRDKYAQAIFDAAKSANPVEDKVTIGGTEYTLDDLKQMNIGGNDNQGLRALGAKLTPKLTYTAAAYGGTSVSVDQRKDNYAQAIFDAAKTP